MMSCRYPGGYFHCNTPEKPPQGKRLILPRNCSGGELVEIFVKVGTFDETNPKKISTRGSRWIGESREHHVGYEIDRDGKIKYLLEIDAFTRRYMRNPPGYEEWVATEESGPVFLLQRLTLEKMNGELTIFALGFLRGPRKEKGDWRTQDDWGDAIDHDYFEQIISNLGKELASG